MPILLLSIETVQYALEVGTGGAWGGESGGGQGEQWKGSRVVYLFFFSKKKIIFFVYSNL